MNYSSVALALALLPLAAWADQPVAKTGESMIQRLDTDGDARLSRAEAELATAERALEKFDALDRDKDGYVTQQEIDTMKAERRAAMKTKAEERWKAADTDTDGNISRAEADASMPMMVRRFDSLDANKDGQISRDEMPAGKHTDGGDTQPPTN